MKTFIKAAEVWVTSHNPMVLVCAGGVYGEHASLQASSQEKTFHFNHGLPGKAWSSGHPIVLTDLDDPIFERTEAAREAGITAAIALPVFAGNYLTGVAVFFCGDDEQVAGAIELWHCDERDSDDLTLNNGYFGSLDHFEFISRHTAFRKGVGLPGIVWQSATPVLMEDLGNSHRFIRSQGAEEAGITTGLGIPCGSLTGDTWLMTFLSAKGTPIARQIEIWMPDSTGDRLHFLSGYTDCNVNLKSHYQDLAVSRGDGVLGRTLLTGAPAVADIREEKESMLEFFAEELGLACLVTIPILEGGVCKSLVAIYW